MLKLYDKIKVKSSGLPGNIVEIDDDGGKRPPIYLIEIDDDYKPEDADVTDVVFWCDYDEIEQLK